MTLRRQVDTALGPAAHPSPPVPRDPRSGVLTQLAQVTVEPLEAGRPHRRRNLSLKARLRNVAGRAGSVPELFRVVGDRGSRGRETDASLRRRPGEVARRWANRLLAGAAQDPRGGHDRSRQHRALNDIIAGRDSGKSDANSLTRHRGRRAHQTAVQGRIEGEAGRRDRGGRLVKCEVVHRGADPRHTRHPLAAGAQQAGDPGDITALDPLRVREAGRARHRAIEHELRWNPSGAGDGEGDGHYRRAWRETPRRDASAHHRGRIPPQEDAEVARNDSLDRLIEVVDDLVRCRSGSSSRVPWNVRTPQIWAGRRSMRRDRQAR